MGENQRKWLQHSYSVWSLLQTHSLQDSVSLSDKGQMITSEKQDVSIFINCSILIR